MHPRRALVGQHRPARAGERGERFPQVSLLERLEIDRLEPTAERRARRVRAEHELRKAAEVDHQGQLAAAQDPRGVPLLDLLVERVSQDGQHLAQLVAVEMLDLVDAHEHQAVAGVGQAAQLDEQAEDVAVGVGGRTRAAQFHPAAEHGQRDLLDPTKEPLDGATDRRVEALGAGQVPQRLGEAGEAVLATGQTHGWRHPVPVGLRHARDAVHQNALADARLTKDGPPALVHSGEASCCRDGLEVCELGLATRPDLGDMVAPGCERAVERSADGSRHKLRLVPPAA